MIQILLAQQTVPGRQYRKAKGADNSVFFTRSLVDADKHVKKLRFKGQTNLTSQEAQLLASWSRDSSQILMRRHLTGTDPQSKAGYSYNSLVFVPADYQFIEIGTYTAEGVEMG